MPEIVILIHGNRSLIDKIINEKCCSERRDLDLYLLSQFHYCQVFVDAVLIKRLNIPLIMTRLYFVKKKKKN